MQVEVPGLYKHNKTGVMYSTLFHCNNRTHGRKDEVMVMYIRSKEHSDMYVREVNEFLLKFTEVK